jgi:hypothetical protein
MHRELFLSDLKKIANWSRMSFLGGVNFNQ